ncbi:MAG: [Fe-Fe] hydrogenase large subunit C-terminal domain-containing protein [Huintestinicola sp.]
MDNLIEVIQERCIGCNACIRVCPSPEANVVKILNDGRNVVEINNDKCVACGECVKACKQKARDYNDDIDRFFKDIKDKKIVVIAHPSIKTAFPGTWQAVLKWFKQNGAVGVYDGSNGADICTWAYVRSIEKGNAQNVISQHCPAVVSYMETYYPNEAKNISPVHSPMSCEAIYIRDYLKINYAVAALTPCPAMKLEFEATGHVAYNITFKRLKEYFRRKKIDFNKAIEGDMHYDFDDQVQGAMGAMFAAPDGLRYNLNINMPDLIAASSSGAPAVYKEINDFAEIPPHRRPQVFDVLSCSGGCGCGCGVGPDDDQSVLDIKNIWREVELDARKRRKTGTFDNVDKQFKKFDEIFNIKTFMRNYKNDTKLTPEPSVKELDEIFESMGKTEDYQRKIDCGACGYRTCADMATAIYAERNIPQNCIFCAREGSSPAVAVNNKKGAAIAVKVSNFATQLLADIENIYASLSNIDEANHQTASRAKIVEDILSKVVGFCSSVESIDADNLPMLVSTLEKLQAALVSLNENVNESVSNTGMIREAMQEVADATTELNVMSHDMVASLTDKY